MVLITGGFGYLGGRVSEYLINCGYRVRIATSRKVPDSIEINSSFEVVLIDLQDSLSLEKACKDVSIVIHLAAMNAELCSQDTCKAELVNVNGTSNLINAAIKQKIKKFIYFSTAHVYCSPLQGKLNENSKPIPIHPYAKTHFLAENLIIDASNQKLINGIVLRLSNGVGSPMHKDVNCWMLVCNDLCRQAVTNKTIKINSSRFLERDFIAISEISRIVEQIINTSNFKNGIFNLSSGSSINLVDLAELVRERTQKILGFNPKIKFDIDKKLDLKIFESLNLENLKLKNYGYKILPGITSEIDGLLKNCENWFNKSV
jgi:UDP-glucose 4-epimerase